MKLTAILAAWLTFVCTSTQAQPRTDTVKTDSTKTLTKATTGKQLELNDFPYFAPTYKP
jgi:hypothetical protein